MRREAAALVRGLIQLGQALELTVVAQGVESEAQLTALRALGCEYAQGPFLVGHEAVLGVVAGDVSDEKSDDESHDVSDDKAGGDTEGGAHDMHEAPSDVDPPEAPADPGAAAPPGESLWAPGTLTT
jgi:EAL domain-containing protein (putative c-di-GMP-specific phosphodiesterase class I)